ncbi:hypothetical protein [Archangium primigenium]|jgi:hypothetical protein|uniref:hypothetical protein n=1 Tax=Melittangium TaxID=44 RepID=UPI00195D055B|nr:hypothetical protein [Archangium primigenium]MBM7119316.1 hypothetical protein [Archangium primigenium]
MGFLKGLGKAIGKIASIAAPIVSMINPLAGAAVKLAGDLASGKNPLQSLMGAATSFIPGGGIFKNLLGKFGGGALGGLLDGAGGNSLLSGALNLAKGKGGITNVLGDLFKSVAGKNLSQLGLNNAAELAAQRMAQTLVR